MRVEMKRVFLFVCIKKSVLEHVIVVKGEFVHVNQEKSSISSILMNNEGYINVHYFEVYCWCLDFCLFSSIHNKYPKNSAYKQLSCLLIRSKRVLQCYSIGKSWKEASLLGKVLKLSLVRALLGDLVPPGVKLAACLLKLIFSWKSHNTLFP